MDASDDLCHAVPVVSDAGKRLVYGETPSDGLVFVPESMATELAQLWSVLYEGTTWGEFKKSVAPKWWHEAVDRYRNLMEQDPPDDEWVDADITDPEGSWPPWLAQEEFSWVPLDIQDEFGSIGASLVSGEALGIDPSFETEVVQAFERAGYSCRRDDALVLSASGQ
jgi:hypothetical protein